ncbi:MAG: DUF3800 domain-containing protein [Patescibacteria group bacterium]|nr:DUF3800 domain-containing protein [Patescibacteria group bacterium]
MNIYIDESGNLGSQGRFFVIACLIPHNHKRITNIVRRARKKNGSIKPLEELKGREMTFPQRQDFLNRLTAKKDFEFAYIVADKNHLKPELVANKHICFNYLTAHLLKSIIKSTNEDITIACDTRNIKVTSGKALQEYLQLKAWTEWGFGHDLSLSYHDSFSSPHIQTADVISNTVLGRYGYLKGHFYRILNPHRRHGIKFPYDSFGA